MKGEIAVLTNLYRVARNTRWVASVVCAGNLLFAMPAAAQSAIGTVGQSDQLEQVVVTAEKRHENLQEVPISVAVISGQALADQNLTDLDHLTDTVPGVRVVISGATSDMYIRGIGSGSNESLDQAVGMFIDDMYYGRSRSSTDTLFDIDRIEILKGPQSTFFGNNAIAGALNIITKKPGDTLDASTRLLYGMYGQYAAEAGIGGPITSGFGARFAVTANGGSGWINDVYLHEHVPAIHNLGGRLTLAFNPLENLDAALKIEGSRDRNSGSAFGSGPGQLVNCPPPPPIGVGTFGGACPLALSTGLPLGASNNENAGPAGAQSNLDTLIYELTANYRQWGQTFTSVTGYYNFNYVLDDYNDPVPVYGNTTYAPEKYHQFSQEFRVASPSGQPIEYLAGIYFQADRAYVDLESNYIFLNPVIPTIPPYAGLVPYLPLARDVNFVQQEHIFSAFGAVSWHVTDQLKLSAGLRGSEVRKSIDSNLGFGTGTAIYGGFVPLPASVAPLSNNIFGQGVPGNHNLSRSDHAFMPSANLQYQIDPAVMIYASYSRGFLAGGFNGLDTSGIASKIPYNPEFVNAYEIGLKSEWFDRRVLFNIDVFHSHYSDLQVSAFEPGLTGGAGNTFVTNAATSVAQGVEIEAQWAATREFRLSANVNYLDSHFIDYQGAPGTLVDDATGVVSQNLSGRPTEYAPTWSGSLTAAYTLPLPGGYTFTVAMSPFFSTGYFLNPLTDFLLYQTKYTKLNGSLSLKSGDGHWGLDLIGKNLTDRVILSSFTSPYAAIKDEPINVALQFRYHW
jgi:outer membrane receptor protein involved in Fe transport